jgi:hypothetical protein
VKKPQNKLRSARRFLLTVLEPQPKSIRRIQRIAQTSGLSFGLRTLRRAASEIGVISESTGFGVDKKSTWSLPDDVRADYQERVRARDTARTMAVDAVHALHVKEKDRKLRRALFHVTNYLRDMR